MYMSAEELGNALDVAVKAKFGVGIDTSDCFDYWVDSNVDVNKADLLAVVKQVLSSVDSCDEIRIALGCNADINRRSGRVSVSCKGKAS